MNKEITPYETSFSILVQIKRVTKLNKVSQFAAYTCVAYSMNSTQSLTHAVNNECNFSFILAENLSLKLGTENVMDYKIFVYTGNVCKSVSIKRDVQRVLIKRDRDIEPSL